jgi:uncharacterized membrane protein YoaK (UPF0700 family)
MFKHQGKTRTIAHNLKIASLLSFVAGIVNVAGFLSVQRLTTNVTGHFAFLVEDVNKLNFLGAFVFLLYILSFFIGSFFSSLVVEIMIIKNERYIYVVPAILELIILSILPFFGTYLIMRNPDILACSLLFAMGLQNSLVTSISNAAVRTTHLTGLFTDLGIELSQLFFYKSKEQRKKLLGSIRLRFRIIIFFFVGGIISGYLYTLVHLWVLLVAASVLLIGLIYDSIKFRLILLKRKLSSDPVR